MSRNASHREMLDYHGPRRPAILRSALALTCLAFGIPHAFRAQSLPATAPTSLPTKNALPAPIAGSPDAPATSSKTQAHRATVTYASGMLDVRADNSSLNQILREIGRLTGMKITGGVADQRVFGNYGPAEPSTILATLLDGTGSNMLLRETADNMPAELVLTPRNGGVTPPNPNAPGFDDGPADDDGDGRVARQGPLAARGFAGQANRLLTKQRGPVAQQDPTANGAENENGAAVQSATRPLKSAYTPGTSTGDPVSVPQPLNNVNGSASNTSPTASTFPVTDSVPTDALPTPSTTPPTTGIVDAPNPPAQGGTTAGSLTPTGNVEVPATTTAGTAGGGTADATGTGTQPGATTGGSTPEQIFQQLQALRQQQQSGSTTTPASTTPAPTSAPQ